MKPNKIKIDNKQVIIKELKMKDGLGMVVILAEIIESVGPYIALLHDDKPEIRIAALSQIIQKTPDLDNKLKKIIFTCTNITKLDYDEMTLAQVIKVLKRIMITNKWDEFWAIAQSLQIVTKESLVGGMITGLLRG